MPESACPRLSRLHAMRCLIRSCSFLRAKTSMSESDIALRADVRGEGMQIPASSEACASTVALAPPAITTGASEQIPLFKRIASFPVMLGMLLVGAVFVAGRAFAVDPDLWWHIKNGQNILDTHHWPTDRKSVV